MSEALFSADEFRRRAIRQADPAHVSDWEHHADYRMNPDLLPLLKAMKLRDAAVLIPVIENDGEPRVILTRRTAEMRKHSGQVAFPGGGIDDEDASPEEAALREAEEEIGLARSFVEPIARLPDYSTMTGFNITPVIAMVQPGFEIVPNPAEVADVFEVPLSFLMNEANHRRESREWKGVERHYFVMPYGERYIWGVTAGILRTLYERLYEW